MSAVTVLIAKLVGTASITNIVGSGGIHYAIAPQSAAPPFLLIRRVDEDDEIMLDGVSGLRETRLSIECAAEGSDTAGIETLGEALISALSATAKESVGGATDVEFWKAGTDITDYAEDRSIVSRIIDFYMRWRA